eukprot:352356-Chlamydomonas_euryale.AAC.6
MPMVNLNRMTKVCVCVGGGAAECGGHVAAGRQHAYGVPQPHDEGVEGGGRRRVVGVMRGAQDVDPAISCGIHEADCYAGCERDEVHSGVVKAEEPRDGRQQGGTRCWMSEAQTWAPLGVQGAKFGSELGLPRHRLWT